MRKLLAVGLVAGAVAAPAAFATGPGTHKPATPAKPVVSYLFKGTVLSHDTPEVVEVSPVKGTNVFARRALAGGSSMTLTLKLGTTKVFSRIVNPDGTKRFVRENPAEIKAGDVVFFHIRAAKGTALADLPAARWVRDFTPDPVPAG